MKKSELKKLIRSIILEQNDRTLAFEPNKTHLTDQPGSAPCSRVAACPCNRLGECISNINSGGQHGQIMINQMNIHDASGQIRAVNAPIQTGGPWTLADFINNDYFIYQGQTYLAITAFLQESDNCYSYKQVKGCPPKPTTSDIPFYQDA